MDCTSDNLLQKNKLVDLDSHKNLLREQIANDLNEKFATFVNRSAALRAFEKKTNITTRQASRYLNQVSTPQFFNLVAIYKFIFNCSDYNKLLKIIPEIISKELEYKNPNRSSESGFSADFSKRILENPAFNYIYWQTADGGYISEDKVRQQFGEFGVDTLKVMYQEKIIYSYTNRIFTTGINRSLPISMKATKKVTSFLINKYFRPDACKEEGNNFIGFNILRFSSHNKNIALKKIQQLYYDLLDLAEKDSFVGERVFAVLCLDKLDDRE